MGLPSTSYEPRSPTDQVLHQVVRDHFESFYLEAARLRNGDGLPGFVEREFREFLQCGALAAGFARVQCRACHHDRLVAFSCTGRGFCPSCGGRRMTERAAASGGPRVLPPVAVRQWVLSLPSRLRYLLAWDHDLCRAIGGVFVRAVLGYLRRRGRAEGIDGGRRGAVLILQRFGGALNLNVHFHALVLDGVFAPHEDGQLRFHRAPRLGADEVAAMLHLVAQRVDRLLERRGLAEEDSTSQDVDPWVEQSPALAGLSAAAVQGVAALGTQAGSRPRRCGHVPDRRTPASAASTSMPASSCPRGSRTASSGCAGMCCVRRSPRTGCG